MRWPIALFAALSVSALSGCVAYVPEDHWQGQNYPGYVHPHTYAPYGFYGRPPVHPYAHPGSHRHHWRGGQRDFDRDGIPNRLDRAPRDPSRR